MIQGKKSIPVMLLVGGLGTRLRALESERCKPMILVNDRPFLEWQVRDLIRQGFSEFLFLTGYRGEQIENHPWKSLFPECSFSCSKEESPLGTGGAVFQAAMLQPDWESAWVVNGDTYLDHALPVLAPQASSSLIAHFAALPQSRVFDASPNLVVEGDRVIGYHESGTLFDAGAIWVDLRFVRSQTLPAPYSIQKLLEPAFKGHQVGFTVLEGTCYDIGTPDRYERFRNALSKGIL